MTKEDKEWMQTIYELRYKNFLFPGLVHCTIYGQVVFLLLLIVVAVPGAIIAGDASTFIAGLYHFVSSHILALACLFAAAVCLLAYRFLVYPYKQDAEEGIKLKVPFVVDHKEYYPITGQYFLKFEGNSGHHFEVDEDTFNGCEEGGTLYREMAMHPNHIFTENDHVNVKLFSMPRSDYGSGGRYY